MTTNLPESCLDLACRMVEFDTVVPYHSGRPQSELPLGEFLFDLATSWGFTASRLPIDGHAFNLLIECPSPQAGRPWLLLDSHLDTVGVDGMIVPPFEPTVRDGKLFGRGACDTKGTGAAMLWALRQYQDQATKPNSIAILYSVGEEHVQLGARVFVSQHMKALDWRPAGIVVGEPTRMNVLAATGGFERWTMVTHGKAAHSSRPERGHNAIYDMAEVIRTIHDDYLQGITASHPLIGKASAAITVVRGGQQVNVVPEHCEITFDRRLVPGEDGREEVAKVQSMLEELKNKVSGLAISHERFESAPPMATIDDGALAETAKNALGGVGITSKITGALFTTNGNHFAAAGIPTIVTGPGDIAQAHTVDEWIEVDQFDQGVEGYLAIMNADLPE